MREVRGVLAPGDFPQGRWCYNSWAVDDEYDAAAREPDLLIVDAHGWQDPAKGWVMELLDDGIVVVEDWVREQPETKVFLNVCNPAGQRISPRKGQTVTYALTVVRGPGSAGFQESKG